ncbi:MAG: phage minor head protein [Lachnospira sp.]
MRESHTVDELARLIRPCIGLTEGDARANARYYDNIVATMRKEHPRMKIESIRRKALDASQKYAEKQHRARAFTIAQTESAFAYNCGADEGIRQAQGEGYLGTMVKRWSTSGDDSVCDICNALEGTEVDMDSDFDFKGKVLFAGQHMLPPAHPRCACAIEYIEVAAPRGRK